MNDRMEGGSDVFATLLWGLRRYAALVLAMVLALGTLVPLLLSHRTDVYTATAQVGPTDKLVLPNTNPLPRIAESVFNNGAVEQKVREILDQQKGDVIPSHVQLIAAQDNIVLDVVAKAPSASLAIQIANQAASAFSLQLAAYQGAVASFTVQHQAILAKKEPKVGGGYRAVALGVLAGLLAGVGVVGLILVMRRPVVDPSSARVVTGSPVIGRVTLPRHGPPDTGEMRAIGLLCRRLLGSSVSVIHLASPKAGQAQQLGGSMTEIFKRIQEVRRSQKRGGPGNLPSVPKVVTPEDSEAWITGIDHRSYTVLVAPEGISTRRLRFFAESHDTGAPSGVVLVSTHRRRTRATEETPKDGASHKTTLKSSADD